MKYLEDYTVPTDEVLKTWTIAQAQDVDAKNKETYWRNKTLVQNARAILMEVAPDNPTLAKIEAALPPYQCARLLEQMKRDAQGGSKS